MKDQVTTIEQSRRLLELGVPADKAVARAEVAIEELMRAKAIEAFCVSNCPKGCSFGADGNIGCEAKWRFIQKIHEE